MKLITCREYTEFVLAYRLLKIAHLSEQHEQLARATLTELTDNNMKGKLKKIFGGPAYLENVSHLPSIKVEPVSQVNEIEEVSFNRNSSFRPGRGRGNFKGAVKKSEPTSSTNFSTHSSRKSKIP